MILTRLDFFQELIIFFELPARKNVVCSCNVSRLFSCLGEDSGHHTKDVIKLYLKNMC